MEFTHNFHQCCVLISLVKIINSRYVVMNFLVNLLPPLFIYLTKCFIYNWGCQIEIQDNLFKNSLYFNVQQYYLNLLIYMKIVIWTRCPVFSLCSDIIKLISAVRVTQSQTFTYFIFPMQVSLGNEKSFVK